MSESGFNKTDGSTSDSGHSAESSTDLKEEIARLREQLQDLENRVEQDDSESRDQLDAESAADRDEAQVDHEKQNNSDHSAAKSRPASSKKKSADETVPVQRQVIPPRPNGKPQEQAESADKAESQSAPGAADQQSENRLVLDKSPSGRRTGDSGKSRSTTAESDSTTALSRPDSKKKESSKRTRVATDQPAINIDESNRPAFVPPRPSQRSAPAADDSDDISVISPHNGNGSVAATTPSADRNSGGPAEHEIAKKRISAEDEEDSAEESEYEEVQASIWSHIMREGVPSWGISMTVHMIAILLLAMAVLPAPEEDLGPLPLVASTVEPVEEMEEIEEEVELQIERPDVEAEAPDISSTMEDVGAAALLGELASVETQAPMDFGSELIDIGDISDFGLDLDELGKGQGKLGDGIGMASFFGVKTKGRRFMYVVDNSNSMNYGKFEMAASELFKSISKLSASHEFYIIFYSDMAYPLFYPDPAQTWVKATPENRDRLRYWLDEVHRCLKTKGEEAMTKAFQMKPDVIYLLGDGSFTDKAVPVTLGFRAPNLVVHTMGFGMKDSARKGFEQIATKFNGKFHEVEVTALAKQTAKNKNRPKNNQRNGQWGLGLGNAKKKKK